MLAVLAFQGCIFFDAVDPAFPLPTMLSPTLQGALKDGFGEAVVDMWKNKALVSHFPDDIMAVGTHL